jgi:hypothetical protein
MEHDGTMAPKICSNVLPKGKKKQTNEFNEFNELEGIGMIWRLCGPCGILTEFHSANRRFVAFLIIP